VLLFVLTLALQALERLRDRQDKDSRRGALLAELSANNSTLKALQQQQTGAAAARPDSTNTLTSSRTIGLGARVAATRAPDGSHVPHDMAGASARKRRGGTVASATTTALSSSSSSSSGGGSSSEGSDCDDSCSSGVPSHAAPPVTSPPLDAEQQAAAASSSHVSRSTLHKSLASRQRDLGGGGGKNGSSSSSSSSSSEEEDTNAPAAGDSLLIRGPTVAHPIPRSMEAADARLKLPIVAEEQPLMDLVHHRTCVLLQVKCVCYMASRRSTREIVTICDVGGGRVKQAAESPRKYRNSCKWRPCHCFLCCHVCCNGVYRYEGGYGHKDGTPGCIVVTQPRRVAGNNIHPKPLLICLQ
jgi:hypothetical protein